VASTAPQADGGARAAGAHGVDGDAAGAPAAAAANGPAASDAATDVTEPTDASDEATPPTDVDLPDDTDELVALSHARLAEFDLATARAAATRLLAVAPDSVHAHRALGAVALAQQEYAQAEHHYGQVLDREPLDEEAHGRLALARQGRQRVEQRTAQRPGRRRSRP
jgi:tetratricopeptide (TPR) repeat protein